MKSGKKKEKTSNMDFTVEDFKAFEKARRNLDWDEFTQISAREFMCCFIRNGYPNTNSEDYIAERSVRWAKALTDKLRKEFEKDETDRSGLSGVAD